MRDLEQSMAPQSNSDQTRRVVSSFLQLTVAQKMKILKRAKLYNRLEPLKQRDTGAATRRGRTKARR